MNDDFQHFIYKYIGQLGNRRKRKKTEQSIKLLVILKSSSSTVHRTLNLLIGIFQLLSLCPFGLSNFLLFLGALSTRTDTPRIAILVV